MTISEHLHKHLTDRGLWDKEADEIMAAFTSDEKHRAVRFRDSTDAYPPMLLSVLRVSLDLAARQWLAENAPKHFARPMFEVPD